MDTEGSIRLVLLNLNSLVSENSSPTVHNIGGLPWILKAEARTSECKGNVKCLGLYVCCNPGSESTFWSCEADVNLTIHNQRDNCNPFSLKFSDKFCSKRNSLGFPSFKKWTDVLDPKRGFIKDNSIIVEAHISVTKTKGLQARPSFDFMNSSTCSDGVLVIDKVRLHINKSYLALYSPVFHELFFGEVKDRNLDEVSLKDTDSAEFIDLLHVIYPSYKSVSAESVEFLLKLGDQYEVKYVMKKCEKFLTKTNEIPVINKLVLADKYRLTKLHDACIQTLKSTRDITAIKKKEEYEKLSDLSKVALFEKLLTLV